MLRRVNEYGGGDRAKPVVRPSTTSVYVQKHVAFAVERSLAGDDDEPSSFLSTRLGIFECSNLILWHYPTPITVNVDTKRHVVK